MRIYGRKRPKKHRGKFSQHRRCAVCHQYATSVAAARRRNHPLRAIRKSERRVVD